MNLRIRELAEQVGFGPAWFEESQPGYPALPKEGMLKEFAELIVRECINEIHVADVGDLKGKSYYLDKVAEHIEKHFGVEE